MINEFFKPESQSIFTFKKGDIIIRVESAKIRNIKSNENLGIEIEVITGKDNSFREPMKFIAIENNLIYLQYVEDKRMVNCNLEDFEEGWALFKVPDGLTLEDCL